MMKSIKYVALCAALVGVIGVIHSLNSSAQSMPETILHSGKVAFPISMPGDTIDIFKMMDGNGDIILRSNSPLIKNATDLVKLERQEFEAKKKKYGALGEGLIKKINTLSDADTLIVKIFLKIQKLGKGLDKTKYSAEEVKENSMQFLKRIPIYDKAAFIIKYGIKETTVPDKIINATFKNSPNEFISKITKRDLANLCFSEEIGGIEEYIEPILGASTCTQCKWSENNANYPSPPCFASLATSAYNPASAMPSDSKGQGVNAATFERGLRNAFINCINVPHLIYYDSASNLSLGVSHSEQTFRCLANAAPQANLYHRGIPVVEEAFIMNNSIQAISVSWSGGSDFTDLEVRQVDSWAYRYPYPVLCFLAQNFGYCEEPFWKCYNAINVGNVQHYNESHFVLNDTAATINCPDSLLYCQGCGYTSCNYGHCRYGPHGARNHIRYGWVTVPDTFDCTMCNTTFSARGDNERPMIVAPGTSPKKYRGRTAVPYPTTGNPIMSDPCIKNDAGTSIECETWGTSYSAPITGGIAACVISASSWMVNWPEKVRCVLLATAQNVDFKYWDYNSDGRDGAGTVSGSAAVAFAKNHHVAYENDVPEIDGICASGLYNSDQGHTKTFNVKIPNPKPEGKHLRIVLTWDSSPSIDPSVFINELSDLDLYFQSNFTFYRSFSWDSNVEMIDVDNSQVTAGGTYQARFNVSIMRIPPESNWQCTYFAIGWTWVKDHAD